MEPIKQVDEWEVAVVRHPSADGQAAKLVLREKFGPNFPIRHYHPGVTQTDAKWFVPFSNKNLLCVGWSPPSGESTTGVKTLTIICSAAALYKRLYPLTDLPEWLNLINLYQTEQVSMTPEQRMAYAALTDDLDSMEVWKNRSYTELVQRGQHLLETHRPMVARTLVSKAEIGTLQVSGTSYRVAYVDLSHEKFLSETTDAFWHNNPPIDFLILRLSLPSNHTRFELCSRPHSVLPDLKPLYSSTVDGMIQLPHNPKYLTDLL